MHDKIQQQMQDALKARDELRLSVLRGMISAFTNELVATKRTPQEKLADDEVIAVITRLAKQRKESITQFNAGNRPDLAEKEEKELSILQEYLPEMISMDEIKKVVEEKKSSLGVEDKSKMGMLMGAVMGELKGKAEGNDVKQAVEEALS